MYDLIGLGKQSKKASLELIKLSEEQRNTALKVCAKALRDKKQFLIEYNDIERQIDSLETEVNYLNVSIEENKKATYENNTELLVSLYEEASNTIKEIKKSFDELVCFHNAMIDNKTAFLVELVNQKQIRLILIYRKSFLFRGSFFIIHFRTSFPIIFSFYL